MVMLQSIRSWFRNLSCVQTRLFMNSRIEFCMVSKRVLSVC